MADTEQSLLQVIVEIVDKVTEPLGKIKEDFDGFSDSVHQIWAAGAEVFAGYEAIKGLVEPAADMAEAQAHLGLATQFGAEKLAEMKDQAEALSATVPQSIEEITGAQEELYKTFGNTANLEEVTKMAAKLGVVLGLDATKGANVLAGAYEQLGDKSKPLAEGLAAVADNMALLKDRYLKPGEATNLERDIQKIGIAAQHAGISQNVMFAMWAEGNKLHAGGPRGFGMQEAGLIDTLDKKSKSLEEAGLQVHHFKGGAVDLMTTLEGINRMSNRAKLKLFAELPAQSQVLVEFASHLKELQATANEFSGGAGGELDKATNVLANTPGAKLEILKNQLSNVADTLGVQVLPQVIILVTELTKLLVGINKFAETHPVLTRMAADFVVIVASLLTLAGLWHFGEIIVNVIKLGYNLTNLGGIFSTLSALVTGGTEAMGVAFAAAFDTNPIGLVLTLLGLVIAAVVLIWTHWDQITSAIHRATEAAISFAHNATGKDWFKEIAGIATGNIALAANTAAGVVKPGDIHYSPTVHVNVGPGTDPHAVAGAVGNQMSLHADELRRLMHENQQDDARRGFGDPTLAGAH
jgi:TP901 family phage tail tape measure protein